MSQEQNRNIFEENAELKTELIEQTNNNTTRIGGKRINIFEDNAKYEHTIKPCIVETKEEFDKREEAILRDGCSTNKYTVKQNGRQIQFDIGNNPFWYYYEKNTLHLHQLRFLNDEYYDYKNIIKKHIDTNPPDYIEQCFQEQKETNDILKDLHSYFLKKNNTKLDEIKGIRTIMIEECKINYLILRGFFDFIMLNGNTFKQVSTRFYSGHYNGIGYNELDNCNNELSLNSNTIEDFILSNDHVNIKEITINNCKINNLYIKSYFSKLNVNGNIDNLSIKKPGIIDDSSFNPTLNFENLDFSKITLNIKNFNVEKSHFINCKNHHQIKFEEVSLEKQRLLFQQITEVLKKDKYLPEAELVFDKEMEIYAAILEKEYTFPFFHSDYLILKFSKWFSNFGKSLWRPLVSVMIAAILGHSLKLWSSDALIWGQLPTAKDVENILAFILDLNLIPLIQNTGFCGILIIALKSFIAYCIYNFLRATRRFNG